MFKSIFRWPATEESLSAFFRQLGFDNFFRGIPTGIYGLEWSHFPLAELDAEVKANGGGGYWLQRTTESPTMRTSAMGFMGGEVVSIRHGRIEVPRYTDPLTGTEYTFVSAKWTDGHFCLQVRIRSTEQGEEFWLTIPQLRARIKVPLLPWWMRMAQVMRACIQ